VTPPPEVAACIARAPETVRARLTRRANDPEVTEHLRRGLMLLRTTDARAPLEVEYDAHDAEVIFVLTARVKGTPRSLIARQTTLHRQWRASVGSRPFRHVLIQIKPPADAPSATAGA
jgi:hypothetical protein